MSRIEMIVVIQTASLPILNQFLKFVQSVGRALIRLLAMALMVGECIMLAEYPPTASAGQGWVQIHKFFGVSR